MTSGGMAPFLESTTTPKEEPMPRPHIAMRKIREVLRLRLGEGLSHRKVAAA